MSKKTLIATFFKKTLLKFYGSTNSELGIYNSELLKHLAYLNKYFLKYKWYLILGIIFTIVSNLFGIIPAQIVRHALDLVKETIDIYFLYDNSQTQKSMYDVFTTSIGIYGLLILAMAILKGIFLFAVRQTIIVMSRHIEFD